jgi:tRNA nucleotidyltransferase (CCA-adding enzyme)
MTDLVEEAILAKLEGAIPAHVLEIATTLDNAGHRTWVVGGSLRDQLRAALDPSLATSAEDWDLATDARPSVVQRLFKKVIPTGIKHGTVTVLLGKQGYEVTTLRGEASYTDGRRPDSVFFVDEIREDLARRDFTVNAIAFDPLRRMLADPFDGMKDLEHRLLRAVGNPAERFGEDGLRVLRAARFVATLEFELDQATADAIRPSLVSFRKVSPERVRDEWLKSMKAPKPSRAFRVMRDHGLLEVTAPLLLEADDGLRFELALRAVDACPSSLHARFAALLHNAGPRPERLDPALAQARSAELAFDLLQSLRFSNKDRDRIVRLVRFQQVPDLSEPSDADLRRWLKLVGTDLVDDLRSVARAVARAQAAPEPGRIEHWFRRAKSVCDTSPALSIGDLAVKGNDLRQELGLAPGPMIGQLLEALLELVIDHPERNEPESLLAAARQWLAQQG